MKTIAKVICPATALVLVWAFVRGVSDYNPEPEVTSPIGWVVLLYLAIVTQVPLAVAPFLRPRRLLKATLALLMLPTFALLALAVIDLLPRLITRDRLPVWVFAIEVLGLFAYALAYAVTLRGPSSDSAPRPTPTGAT